METEEKRTPSKVVFWTGWVFSILPALFLFMSASLKFIKPPGFAEGLEHMGWDEGKMTSLGILEITCTIIYLIPKTAVLGAILLAAYMGGAVATHVRVGDPFIVQVLIGMALWLGLWLRDPRLRELIPLRK